MKGMKEERSRMWNVEHGTLSVREQFAARQPASQLGPLSSAQLYSQWVLVAIDLAVLHDASRQT
jgi:hypothetical protein